MVESKRNGHSTSILASPSSPWSRNQYDTTNTLRAKFSNGQRCYNGPSRSLSVEFVCGIEDDIIDVINLKEKDENTN